MQTACKLMHVGKTIQIRGVPEDIHRTLRHRAALAGVSLSDYLLGEIARVAARPPVADVIERAGLRGGGTDSAHIIDAVRSGRDLS